MRFIFRLLLIATLASALWACILFLMLPLGHVDRLVLKHRQELRQAVGTETRSQLTEQAVRVVSEGIQQAVLLVGLPFVLTSVAWAIFSVRLLKSHRQVQHTLQKPSAVSRNAVLSAATLLKQKALPPPRT